MGRRVDVVVLHRAECKMSPGKAKAVANWFASESCPEVSAHYVVDPSEVVKCVSEQDVAYHAPPLNTKAVGVELVGYTRDNDWNTEAGSAMILHTARLVADICIRWGVPPVWLTVEDLIAGKRGITGHGEVSRAFRKSDHTDPGIHFPRDAFVRHVELAIAIRNGEVED